MRSRGRQTSRRSSRPSPRPAQGPPCPAWMKTASPPPSRISETTPLALRRPPRGYGDPGALAGELQRRCLADARVSAGDQGHLAVELSSHYACLLGSQKPERVSCSQPTRTKSSCCPLRTVRAEILAIDTPCPNLPPPVTNSSHQDEMQKDRATAPPVVEQEWFRMARAAKCRHLGRRAGLSATNFWGII